MQNPPDVTDPTLAKLAAFLDQRRKDYEVAAAASAVCVLERCASTFAEGPAALLRARSNLEAVKAQYAQRAAVAPSQGNLWGDAEKPQLDDTATHKPSWL